MADDVKKLLGKFRRKEEKVKRSRCYWLLQSDSSVFSIQDLEDHPTRVVHWDASRNLEANKLIKQMQEGDKAFFFHAKCATPAIVGIVSIARDAFVDERQFDKYDKSYEPIATTRCPVWFQVDIKYERALSRSVRNTELLQYTNELRDFTFLTNPSVPIARVPLSAWTFIASLLLKKPQIEPKSGLHQIQPDEIAIPSSLDEGRVGEGAYGTVLKGVCRGKEVAVKVFFKSKLDSSALAAFDHEVGIVSSKHHPNIVQFLGICHMGDRMVLVTDYMPRGNLHEMLMDKSVDLNMLTRMRMARDVALGMNWLHESVPQVIHRDLKTKNLLIDADNRIKICDFGLSQLKEYGSDLQDPSSGAKGTPLWMAPEVLMGEHFDEKIDVYSFGLVLWQIITRGPEPFKEFEKSHLNTFCDAVCSQDYRPQLPENVNPKLAKLITACWSPDPSKRPSFTRILGYLDEIIVGSALNDRDAQKFWFGSFHGSTQVSWKAFEDSLVEYLTGLDYGARLKPLAQDVDDATLALATDYQLNEYSARGIAASRKAAEIWKARYGSMFDYSSTEPDEEIALVCLRELLTSQISTQGLKKGNKDDHLVVDLEQFGHVLACFGPMVDKRTGYVVLLDNIRRILAHEWFHGALNQNDAKALLLPQEPGTFLVRFSSMPGSFTISSVTSPGEIIHRRCSYSSNGVTMFYETHPTMEALLSKNAEELGLLQACPGSRFRNIFDDSRSSYILPDSTNK